MAVLSAAREVAALTARAAREEERVEQGGRSEREAAPDNDVAGGEAELEEGDSGQPSL